MVGIGDGYSSPRYEGGARQTTSGKPCQFWEATYPHDHKYDGRPVNDAGQPGYGWPNVGKPEHNCCRNPGMPYGTLERRRGWHFRHFRTSVCWAVVLHHRPEHGLGVLRRSVLLALAAALAAAVAAASGATAGVALAAAAAEFALPSPPPAPPSADVVGRRRAEAGAVDT